MRYPKDCSARIINTEARKIFPNNLNSIYWEHHEQTGTDHGTDMIIEYIENEEYHNNKIECQIKGTANIENYKRKKYISYPLDIKTINYGLNCRNGFVFILVDINTKEVYYVALQDYFIAHKEFFYNVMNNKETVSIQIDEKDSLTRENDFELRQIAKSTYKRVKDDEILKIL